MGARGAVESGEPDATEEGAQGYGGDGCQEEFEAGQNGGDLADRVVDGDGVDHGSGCGGVGGSDE